MLIQKSLQCARPPLASSQSLNRARNRASSSKYYPVIAPRVLAGLISHTAFLWVLSPQRLASSDPQKLHQWNIFINHVVKITSGARLELIRHITS